MADNRVTCRGHSTYHTRRNIWKKVRTPGHRLTTLRVRRKPLAPKCQISGARIQGIKRAPVHSLKHYQRTVSRAYGGTMTMNVVRDRILRAFLCEEAKEAKAELKKRQANQARK